MRRGRWGARWSSCRGLPGFGVFAVAEQVGESGDLLEPEELIGVQPKLLADLVVAPARLVQDADELAHATDGVLAARPVVLHRGGDPASQVRPIGADPRHWQAPPHTLSDLRNLLADAM